MGEHCCHTIVWQAGLRYFLELLLIPWITLNGQQRNDYCSVSGVAFSFNGGKDSTVLLHIIRAAIALPLPERTADLNGDVHGKLLTARRTVYKAEHHVTRCVRHT